MLFLTALTLFEMMLFVCLPLLYPPVLLLSITYMRAGVLAVLLTLLSPGWTWHRSEHFIHFCFQGHISKRKFLVMFLTSVIAEYNIYPDASLLAECHPGLLGKMSQQNTSDNKVLEIDLCSFISKHLLKPEGGLKHTNPILFPPKITHTLMPLQMCHLRFQT